MNTQFKQVNYTLSGLLDQIDLGVIGLPDIQRPFVWTTVKVRDLFDSMYRGYPVGYLLFWENVVEAGAKQIGAGEKQLAPQQMIVDGQQRLTSLYAVVKGRPIITQDYKETHLRIAFRPRDERFEVTNPAIERDAEWISNISELFNPAQGLLSFVKSFLDRLKATRLVTPEEEQLYEERIQRLWSLGNFPFTALSLSSSLDEERVSEIFVRINSEGVRLNQADFILTLMSVFWEKGRKQLEDFCRAARIPSKGEASPFNYFIEPRPDQLLRASIAVAFRRARLQAVYSILRGKDLQTGEFSAERRQEQFDRLAAAQEAVLDLNNWHEFLKAVTQAGYRGSKMLASETNLIYCYAMWLIGLVDFGVEKPKLREVISRWFYMTAVTSRYTGSSETRMEADLARLRSLGTADEFVAELDRICASELTNDFWTIRLPNDLERRSARTPALFSYYAALCVLKARVLFSKQMVSDLLDPAVKEVKQAIERHHLFPRAYLESIGIKSLTDINQIANYALVEWGDNIKISDTPPAEYFPIYAGKFSPGELADMMFWHALPAQWETMDYHEFLTQRRELLAAVIRAGWVKLSGEVGEEAPAPEHAPAHWSVEDLIERRESARVEFKSAARWNYRRGDKGKEIEDAVVRTVAGFMNRDGGTLIIGVDDEGIVLGLEKDLSTVSGNDLDGFENWLTTLFELSLGKHRLGHVAVSFVEIEDQHLCRVDVKRSKDPVWAKTSQKEDAFYVRFNNSTRELNSEEAHRYIKDHFGITA